MTVLIVDDVSVMRLIIKETLVNYCGVSKEDIYEADNGNDAIKRYKNIEPDVVFLDITMPGLDGISAVKEIVRYDPDAHIIMCTSMNDRTDVKECIRAGAKDYIRKPPTQERVIKSVQHLLPPELQQKNETDEASLADKLKKRLESGV